MHWRRKSGHCSKNPECMHYTELAESVKHFKEKEGGREEMSEIVERYGDERALMANITSVQNWC